MRTETATALLLAVILAAPAASAQVFAGRNDTAAALAMKRVAERYALTQARIAALVTPRQTPAPLPAQLPNPFHLPLNLPSTAAASDDPAGRTVVPALADESDADTLARFAATLRISGLTVLKGVPHLTLNQTLCKGGDIIPYEIRGRTVYIQVVQITPDELTLGLNKEHQTVRVRR